MRYVWRTAASILAVLITLIVTPTYARQEQAIRVIQSATALDFPNQIVFSLQAESSAADITQVQLLYGATRSDAFVIVDLPVQAGRQVSTEHTLDTQVYHFPPGTDMSYRWVIRDAAGNMIESEKQNFTYHDTRFNWSERTVRSVTFYWHEGGDSFGDELAGAIDRALTNLAAELDTELTQPVRIYVYASQREMYSALQSNSAEWIGGEASPSLGVIVAAIEPNNLNEVRRIIPHELSHQVLYQAIKNPYGGAPPWFDEGLAVHHQEVRDLNYDQLVDQAAEANQLIPLEALASSFPADPDQAVLSYAESRDMVEYILDTYGQEKIQALAEAFAAATPVDTAVQEVLGHSVDDLDAAWREGLPEPTGATPDLAGPSVAPEDRFREAPVLPSGVTTPDVKPIIDIPGATEPSKPAFIIWLEGLPAWTTISAAALCCVTGVVLLGVVLLVGLRMIGVDKRAG
ncbi:MAG: hypothetical protein HGA19_15270 [Oscillochloris sp.]|nr:hypothetical protein [Oscillochloris sp.]